MKANEAQTKQTHWVQEEALVCTFSSPKMDPGPFFHHSISPSLSSFLSSQELSLPAHLPTPPPAQQHRPLSPAQGWGREVSMGRGSIKSEEHQDQRATFR